MLNDFEGTVGESQPFLLSIDFTGKKEYNYVYEDGVIVRSTECDITVNGEAVEARTPVNTRTQGTVLCVDKFVVI